MTRKAIMLDIDGTCALEHGISGKPNVIPEELKEILRWFYETGYLIMFVTGAPWCLAERFAQKMGFDNVAIAADYGVAVRRPDGREDLMVDPRQYEAFLKNRRKLIKAIKKVGGTVDRRNARFQINAFFPNKEAWERGKEAWGHLLAENPQLGDLFLGSHIAGDPLLRQQWNPSDNSVNLLTFGGTKECAVRWARQRRIHVIAGAGDTGSDAPLARAADYFVVARRAPGAELAPILVDIVQEKGDGAGYLAPTDQLHGHGVAAGLRLLRQRIEQEAAASNAA